jgi:hypothetical protein
MRAWAFLAGAIFAGMMARPAMALVVCDGGNTIRDWGLHRSWTIERDCAHPERPAKLVEIPWTQAPVPRSREKATAEPAPPPPDVRRGMRVSLGRRGEKADIRLVGTALSPGRVGDRVQVKAGLGGATLEGIVRGPGLVELQPGKAGK